MSERASFRNRYQGGEGLAGATATITEAVCLAEYTADGKFATPSAALRLVFEVEGRDEPFPWHYTLGDSSRWGVTDDGNFFVPLFARKGGGSPSIGANTDVGVFAEALEKNAPDLFEAFADKGAEALVGVTVRLAMTQRTKKTGSKADVYIIEEVLGEGEGAGADEEDSLEVAATEIIAGLLENGPVKVAMLPTRIMAVAKSRSDVRALMQLAQNKDFLAAEGRPWTFNAKKNVLESL